MMYQVKYNQIVITLNRDYTLFVFPAFLDHSFEETEHMFSYFYINYNVCAVWGQCEVRCNLASGTSTTYGYKRFGLMPDGVPCVHTGATFADTYELIRWSGTKGHCVQGYCRVFHGLLLLYILCFIYLVSPFYLLLYLLVRDVLRTKNVTKTCSSDFVCLQVLCTQPYRVDVR